MCFPTVGTSALLSPGMGMAFPSFFRRGEGELFFGEEFSSLCQPQLSPPTTTPVYYGKSVNTIAWDFVIPPSLTQQQQQQEQGFSTCGDPGLTRLQDQDQE